MGAVGCGDYDIGPDWSILKYLRGLPKEQRESSRILDLGTGDGQSRRCHCGRYVVYARSPRDEGGGSNSIQPSLGTPADEW